MPFLAMKMDSSLPNITKTIAQITKNGRFTQTIWTIIAAQWGTETNFRPLFGEFLYTNTVKLKQANAIIAVLNVLGIPKSCSLSSNTVSIISIPSNGSTAMGKHNLETISLPLSFSSELSRSPVFSKWCKRELPEYSRSSDTQSNCIRNMVAAGDLIFLCSFSNQRFWLFLCICSHLLFLEKIALLYYAF